MARDSAFMTAHLRSTQYSALAVEQRKSLMIPHNDRSLEAIFVSATSPSAAVLLFHGIGDRLDYWKATQTMFAQHGIASLVFHYSGYGESTGSITQDNLHQDSLAAYSTLRSLLPAFIPLYLLGFSLGTGVATEAAPHFSPPPAGLILCQGFTSLRAAGARIASPVFAPILPDLWRTYHTVATLQMPLLVVHGDADELFPTAMAQQIADAGGVTLIQPRGFAHSDAYLRPTLDYWQPILDFILRPQTKTR